MKITEWILVILLVGISLVVILALSLSSTGPWVQSQHNNTIIKATGMSEMVNTTGSLMISLGNTLQLALIILGIVIIVVIIGIVLFFYYSNKKERNDNYPPF